MSRTKRIILALVIVFVLIATALTVTVAVLFNTTLEKIGISDKKLINGKSLADMKLQDYTPKDLYPLVKSLFRDNSSLVNYSPASSDRQALDKAFETSSIATLLTGIRYSRLIYSSATFSNERLLVFTDKQLSALLNNVVRQAPSDVLLSTSAAILEYLGVKAIKEVLDCLVEYNVTVEQVRLTAKDGTPHLKLLLSMDISKHAEGVHVVFLGDLNPKVYVGLDYSVNVTSDGEIDLTYVSLSVNGKDPDLSEKVLDGLFIALNKSKTKKPMSTKSLADGVASFLAVIFEHVGVIGDATSAGMSGVDTAKRTISFVAAASADA